MEQENHIMGKLSHHLREKVILESNLQIITQCKLLTSNFSDKFLHHIALKMTVSFSESQEGFIQSIVYCIYNSSFNCSVY